MNAWTTEEYMLGKNGQTLLLECEILSTDGPRLPVEYPRWRVVDWDDSEEVVTKYFHGETAEADAYRLFNDLAIAMVYG